MSSYVCSGLISSSLLALEPALAMQNLFGLGLWYLVATLYNYFLYSGEQRIESLTLKLSRSPNQTRNRLRVVNKFSSSGVVAVVYSH